MIKRIKDWIWNKWYGKEAFIVILGSFHRKYEILATHSGSLVEVIKRYEDYKVRDKYTYICTPISKK